MGNDNRFDHGFYSRYFRGAEQAVVLLPVNDVEGEIALSRVIGARLLERLSEAQIATEEMVKLAALALASARTTSRLLRDSKVLSGQAADDLSGAIGQVLDELSRDWGVSL